MIPTDRSGSMKRPMMPQHPLPDLRSRLLPRQLCLVASLFVCASPVLAGGTDEAGASFFESRVRPLLVEHCYRCHSAKAEKVKAGLLVDSREGLLKGGESGPGLVLGQPERSRLIEAVRYANPELQMPPRGRLSAEQVADLVRWVELGAPWSGSVVQATAAASRPDMGHRRATHWAWQPVRTSAPPAVADEGWVRTRVDPFILARLDAAGLRPAPPADRRSLLRRIHFALLGLPPTTEEVENFLQDQSLDALERVADRLLASPRFGERWARHWMDLVRYSDTLGNEADMPIPNAWRYRDYLVRAFNADLPYDRLILEHLGGDLLDDPRYLPDGDDNESVLATAFFWMSEGKRSPVRLAAGPGGLLRQPPRRDGQDLPRPDHRLRPLPRPQVRPDHPGGLLRPLWLSEELSIYTDAAERRRARRRGCPDGCAPDRDRSGIRRSRGVARREDSPLPVGGPPRPIG